MMNLPSSDQDVTAELASLHARVASLERTLQNYELIVQNVNDAIIVTDAEYRVQRWNRAAEEMYGWTSAEVLGKHLPTLLRQRFLTENGAEEAIAMVMQQGVWKGTIVQHHRDGHEIVVETSIRLIRDKNGAVVGLVGIDRDITSIVRVEAERTRLLEQEQRARAAAEAGQRQLTALAHASRIFAAASLDLDMVFSAVTRAVAEAIGDLCAIRLLSDDGQWLLPGTSYHPDPQTWGLLQKEYENAPQPVDQGLAGVVVRTGQSLLMPVVPPDCLDEIFLPTYRQHVDHYQIHSCVVVPLRIHKQIIGVLIVARDRTSEAYTPDDQAFVEDLADRAALAIHNARLYHTVQTVVQRNDETVALLDTLLETAPIGFAFYDRELRCLRINEALATMSGVSVQAQLGRTIAEAPSELAPIGERPMRQVLATGQAILNVEETSHTLAPEGPRHWLMNYYPVRTSNGTTLGVGVLVVDITERIQGEQALRESEARLRSILDRAPSVIYLKDLEGRQLFVNQRFAALFGRDRATLIGFTDDELFPPDLAERFRASDAAVLAARDSIEIEEVVAHNGRDHTYASIKFPLFDLKGVPYAICGISIDITERKQLQAQLIQSQKMEGIGRLAGGIAHDFNNLLTAIIGFAQLALDSLASDDPVRGDLDEIQKAVGRASDLTRQLLTFARKQIIAPQILDLNALIMGMDKLLRRLIGEDIEFATFQAGRLHAVKADPGQIEQVLVNLVINARDAMPRGGRLTISTRNITLSADDARVQFGARPGNYVQIAISDNGIGMPPDVQARLFEPFFTTKEQGKGTGLGLAMCYGIVQQHGGHITFDSEPGRGTTFMVYLPRAEGDTHELLRREHAPKLPRGSETILLVEDEEAVQLLAARVLREQGYTVLQARDGAEALQIARTVGAGAIQLLLTDLVLPHIGGKAVAERLAELDSRIKVLFISGYTDETLTNHGRLGPDVMLLQKPFTISALVEWVREALDR